MEAPVDGPSEIHLSTIRRLQVMTSDALAQVCKDAFGQERPNPHHPQYQEVFATMAKRVSTDLPSKKDIMPKMTNQQALWTAADWARYCLAVGQYQTANEVARCG